MKKYSEEVQRLLKTVVDSCSQEDEAVRQRQMRQWRRLKLLWEGFSQVWYDSVAHDWRVYDDTNDQNNDQSTYDKPVNVFRAYLESIIAALSIVVPPVKCFPDDADNTLDLATARAGDKISQLVYRHNEVSLLWLHALFVFVTEGLVACYSYPKSDESFGTYSKKEYEDVEEEHEITTCSSCGSTISDSVLGDQKQDSSNPIQQNDQQSNSGKVSGENLENQEHNEYATDDEDAPLHYAINNGQELCPVCMMMMDPSIVKQKFVTTRLVGITSEPKGRVCLEAYGGLNIKVPNYAKTQEQCPYLIFDFEEHYAIAMEKYSSLRGNNKLRKQIETKATAGSVSQYDQFMRLSPQYRGEYPINVVTTRQAWIRPSAYNILNDKEDVKKLQKLFPDGAKITYVNDNFAEACNESLDDCWTLTHNPMSDYLHHDPLGQVLVNIQEITNDLISLILQTIEHGIGQTFADPAVLNFKGYEQTEVLPGGIFPATPKSGKSLNDGFHELRTATLSGEVLPFSQNIQSMGQLVSGALPSLFGGNIQGSETASQYSMSRAQALQRLQNTYKLFTIWWKNIFGKVVPMYIKLVQEDEKDVQRDRDGNFINVFIRRAELEGKIGKVELEAADNLPQSWGQIKDTMMQLLQTGSPEILSFLSSAENLDVVKEVIGVPDFYVPGEDDRIKQYDEIKILLESVPLQEPDPQTGQIIEVPSVEIDPIFDNNEIEFEICRKWIVSEVGRQAKIDNPEGYKNVLLHGRMHYQMIQSAQMQNQAGVGAPPLEKVKENSATPITGEKDVKTV